MPDLEVDGRRLRIANLDRIVFPATGTTKAELLDHYVRVAPAMLPHLRDRLLHMHRYPEGVEGPRFWQKQCPDHRPSWVPTAPVWSEQKRGNIEYCVANELAAVLWAVNLGSIELHTSLHRRDALHRPTVVVFDLDPGPGRDVLDCAQVALELRTLLAGLEVDSRAKTSGSKGLQVYVPLNTEDVSYEQTKPFARSVAELMEERHPDLVVSRMARSARAGKVLVDWGQNTEHKSMVCVYSVRAKAQPTVSTPLRWEEVQTAADAAALTFDMTDARARVEAHGDLFAPVLELEQRLPPL